MDKQIPQPKQPLNHIPTNGKGDQPFLKDVQTLRAQARAHLEMGAVTTSYEPKVAQTIEILQSVLATEIVCVLRYTMNAITASGISSNSVKEEFLEHAKEEQDHVMAVGERINQLGGTPNFNPEANPRRFRRSLIDGLVCACA